MKTIVAYVNMLSLSGLVFAQAQWASLGVQSAAGYGAPACYEASRDQVLVPHGPQMWLFDGQSWTFILVAPAPNNLMLVHDPRRARTVAVDGWQGVTWEWDGGTWTIPPVQTPAVGPVCYHAGRERVVALGRNTATSPWELHEWDGTAWSLVASPNSPPPTIGLLNLVYDIARDRLVSFGPVVGGAYTNQTWEWDPANGWLQVTAGGPASLSGLSLVYDAARQRQVLLTWGSGASSPTQTWERTNGTWILQTTPQLLLRGTVVHDSLRSRCLLINQDGFTWSYAVQNRALYQPHGAGCAGSLGTPELALTAPWTLPWLNQGLGVTVDRLPLGIAVLAMGFQDQTLGTTPLPLDLTPYGGPGCFLRMNPQASLLIAGTGGSASSTLFIPWGSVLLGQRFFQQALSLDPGSNALGGVMTNSMVGTVGRL